MNKHGQNEVDFSTGHELSSEPMLVRNQYAKSPERRVL